MNIAIISPFNPQSMSDKLHRQEYTDIPSIYNAATSITSIARGLLEIGHKVTVFTLSKESHKKKGSKWYRGSNLNICIVNRYKPIRGYGRFDRLLQGKILSCEIAKHLENIDVLHAHWTYEYADACIPFVDKRPVFCTIDDWQPYIRTIYNKKISDWFYWTIISGIVFKKIMRMYPKIHFVANSHYTQKCLENYFKGEHFEIIYNAIPHEYIIDNRTDYPKVPILLSICQNLSDPRKNISSLVEAFHIYKSKYLDAQLWLIGGYNDKVINLWKDKGWMEGITLLGIVQHKEIWSILDKVSLLIHPSLEETFGGILIEAMARKVPVVGGIDSGAVPYVLEFGKIGELCDICSPICIYQSIEKVINNQEYRNSLISNATEILNEKYSNIAVAKLQVSMYEKYMQL